MSTGGAEQRPDNQRSVNRRALGRRSARLPRVWPRGQSCSSAAEKRAMHALCWKLQPLHDEREARAAKQPERRHDVALATAAHGFVGSQVVLSASSSAVPQPKLLLRQPESSQYDGVQHSAAQLNAQGSCWVKAEETHGAFRHWHRDAASPAPHDTEPRQRPAQRRVHGRLRLHAPGGAVAAVSDARGVRGRARRRRWTPAGRTLRRLASPDACMTAPGLLAYGVALRGAVTRMQDPSPPVRSGSRDACQLRCPSAALSTFVRARTPPPGQLHALDCGASSRVVPKRARHVIDCALTHDFCR